MDPSLNLDTAVQLGQSGGLFAFAWLVYQQVALIRQMLERQTAILAQLEERTREL